MKKAFLAIVDEVIERPGIDKLIDWLEKTDFFTAPASSRFHGAYEGGLVEHSINMYEQLVTQVKMETDLPGKFSPTIETLAIIGLFHDVCKANTYVVEQRNVKVDGKWEKQPYYKFEEKFSFGHGDKSVFLIQNFLKLTVEEAVCIRYHMGAYEGQHAWSALGNTYKKFPLALLTHFADMRANHILEKK